MEYAFLLGRILLGGFFVNNAYNHFANADAMSSYAGSRKVPAPRAAVLGSGVLLLIGGLSILLGYRPVIGIAALVLFLVPVSFWMHNFWKVTDPMLRMSEMINFSKNIAILGAILMLLLIPRPWPLSLG